MSAAKKPQQIYNIPAGIAFAKALAAQLIAETKDAPERLATYHILLPTRRAIRVLQEAFTTLNEGKPLILPRLQALGDIDEEELSLLAENMLEIPPALPPLKRQLLLARTILKIPGYTHNFEEALLLSTALGRLMDQIYTENLDFTALASLVPNEFAEHWQITLTFMTILSERWPEILREEGMIDAADRRRRLLQALAAHWRQFPPQTPVIAAGTTGSIPATLELLQVIAALPQGQIILPGLDREMDAESWQLLEQPEQQSHPQYGLWHLLHNLGVERNDIRPWPGTQNLLPLTQARHKLATEIMRPAAITARWSEYLPYSRDMKTSIASATENLSILHCGNEREEAAVIALLLRETLETPGRTAALITPRRSLARRVQAACRRWGIIVDDSAGQPLDQTRIGSFLLLSAGAAAVHFSPVSLLALLKHPFCETPDTGKLDLELRGLKPAPGLNGLKDRDSHETLRVIAPILERFMAGSPPEKPRKFSEILTAHLSMAQSLAGPESNRLWSAPEGEEAAKLLSDLLDHAAFFPDMDLKTYETILKNILKPVTVRPSYGTHPRLHILGQLEARMTDADLIIMACLNEKSWPPDPGFDPWMSRPMRQEFGLPAAERQIGLAAHDFVQAFCSPSIVITRSVRQDGAPTVPARWLQRLSAVCEASGVDEQKMLQSPILEWARTLDSAPFQTLGQTTLRRPEPRPPLTARPRKISVTKVEKWQQDPYSIYAEYILKLKKLKPLEKDIDYAEKGELLHNILKRFTDAYPADIPKNAATILVDIAAEELAQTHTDPSVWNFWQKHFEKIAGWLAQHEREWRTHATLAGTEIEGNFSFAAPAGPFTLYGRADRIDAVPGGGAVIDYKSGGNFAIKAIKTGELPQLALEGLMLSKGGFTDIAAMPPVSLQYWKMTGGKLAGEIIAMNDNPITIITNTEAGLKKLVEAYDDAQTPYYSLPRLDNAPRFNDYKHLARVAEWAALGDDETGSETSSGTA